RLAGSLTPDGSATGLVLGVRTQLEPGWWISAGGGVTQTDRAGEDARGAWRGAISSPRRDPLTAMVSYTRTPLDATALLIQRQVAVDELNLAAAYVAAQGCTIAAGGGGADFHGHVSGETNRRTNGNLAVTRRFARFFTLGAAGRAFGFDKD